MLWGISCFLLWQLAGGGLGWWQGGSWGAALGVAAATWAWFFWDLLRGARVRHWLRTGELADTPIVRGVWGEAADRVRRLLRTQEAQIRTSQNQLQEILAALHASPNGVVLLDAQGRIEWCNQMAANQFGLDAQRDVMQSIGNLLRNPEFTAYFAAKDFSGDVVIEGHSSTPSRPVRISVHLHPYGDGCTLLLSRDVTALEQADAMRRDFVANVSHEIRTPLTVLTGFVETLQTLPLSTDERARYLGMMAQQAQRMQSVVQDLLTLSRLEGSPPPGMAEWTPVQTLMQRCEEEARALSCLLTQHQPRPHALRFPPAEVLCTAGEIAGVPAELQSALSNLISNAVRYTPAGSSISVRWERKEDDSAVFSVHDTGPGIAPEHIPRLTERFYRVDRSRSRETGGTGLGLAIVKHVLQRHGATLGITSTLGKGSVFSVSFPANRLRSLARPAHQSMVAALHGTAPKGMGIGMGVGAGEGSLAHALLPRPQPLGEVQ
ncbi:phosphate regulon sensor histidine kinase PhoR [Verminephrobacter aporrectodeae]|uniref:phosphate regulon sensor histidine kinase PhoR n=1 Tax=Verminephrobacter aporrectodeae TaxID=1110389 RepID=UPI0022380EDB|nr:phosphate regulon sensor histidine kinase PhoR [Verminephrobacter aporrectodeae]MCW5255965.1 phosphate regulon sensor histidine kinase PhoR [Verminephrobacter aporrectodeae subsp. tuberculatae]MCW8165935.1 phosphate regulon sensor histidine kinase PhoR [Verminephrobacter aporrectodeae subsp. tuberculatae]MCW8169958.1 phosphate regulon sensor histidine kinase PhoR [Verminephrobacter aporrectodeae subsp. tuberculatae]MCW8177531.1 phosphate regulon sensor histidine kinase PhoR [Verminephrobacte